MGISAGAAGLADILGAGATDAGIAGLTDLGIGAADIAGPTALGTAAATIDPAAAAAGSAVLGGGASAVGTIGDTLAAPAAIGGGLGSLGSFAGDAIPMAGTSTMAPGPIFGGTPTPNTPIPGDTGVASLASPTTAPIPGPTAGPTGAPPGGGAGGPAPAGAGPIDYTQSQNIFPVGGASPIQSPGVTGATGPVGGAAPTSGGGTDVLGQIGSFLKSPQGTGLQAILGAGGLGYSLYSQNQTQKKDAASITGLENQANANAASANAAAAPTLAQGQLLTSYLTTGTLPAPIQAQLDQATAAAKAAIIANAGARGVSTDPTQNSALAADLAAADQQALATKGTLETQMQSAGTAMISQANSLIATGLNATQMDAQLQEYLLSLDNQLSTQTGQAIANFAAALGGGRNITTGKGGSVTISG